MAKKCDFLVEKGSRYFCLLRGSEVDSTTEISDTTYKEYCKYDEIKRCPIFLYREKEVRR